MALFSYQEVPGADARRVPQRRCIVCKSRGDKESFLRFFIDSSGNFTFDPEFRLGGYGIYVCPSERCIRKIRKKLKGVRVDTENLMDKVRQELEDVLRKKTHGGMTSRTLLFMADRKGRVYFYFKSLNTFLKVGYIKFKLEQLCSRS